ncbi:Fur family transcriptional regulator [Roseibacillus ishigakijimensis]|uniref:Transcriptional repressor n=1 Tax=Roseibacillus ishigakijimensis TaxID=454146 RepID=A0A934RRN7_9BACT|nr:transcriptional repressor [Roseibacillus ishigakijimensis]MBK1833784.1 transcriptional repressor [Roseibacillus ishigakijimensis]
MERCEHGHYVCADTILARAKEAGLRKTKALQAVVTALAEEGTPMPLNDLEKAPGVAGLCDRTTLFRLLNRLSEHGLVRRLGLHERAAYFTLAMPGGHHDYLICKDCGSVEILELACPVKELEEEVARTSGYRNLYHELEIYGVCPACHG